MEHLPYIDTVRREIPAGQEVVWSALLRSVRVMAGSRLPAPLAAVLAPEQRSRAGHWRERPEEGDTLPGFRVAEVAAPERLVLTGRHRFSSYRLSLTLRATGTSTLVEASTHAVFPGVAGRLYRLLVIDSRMHVLVVRRLLDQVARRTTER